jgi:hypothetical protein
MMGMEATVARRAAEYAAVISRSNTSMIGGAVVIDDRG